MQLTRHKKIKVAFFVGVFPAVSESWLVEQIEELLKRNFKIDLFVFKRGDLENISGNIQKLKLLDKATFLEFPLPWRQRFLKAAPLFLKILLKKPFLLFRVFDKRNGPDAWTLKYLFWVAPLFDKIKSYDLVHCHFGTTGNKFLVIDRILKTKKKLIVSFYGLDGSMYLKKRGKDFYRKLIERADYILPNSDYMRHSLIKYGFNPKKTFVQYLGVNFSKYKFKQRIYKKGLKLNIVFVGRFVAKKGINDILQAIARVYKIYPKRVKMHIVGGGQKSREEAIKKMVNKLNLQEAVKFYGLQPHDKVLKILEDMHLMIQLSRVAPDGDMEGLPYVLTEAQALGIPVISTYHAGIPEEVSDGQSGFLVKEGDWQKASEKILFFIENPEEIERFSRQARNFIQNKFNIQKTIDNLVDIYNLCLKSEK